MIFDTHCHLTSSRYKKNLDIVIEEARAVGVSHILIPGTDLQSSLSAIEIAKKYPSIYAAVGLHPHLIEKYDTEELLAKELSSLANLLHNTSLVAIGEIGLDITLPHLNLQKYLFRKQLELALEYEKTVIIHSRGTAKELLDILNNEYKKKFMGKMVFHCCEPENNLLEFAQKNKITIGVDGDITYSNEKKEFISRVPLELLVVETDSPYLLPEPLRSQKLYPNVPKNIKIIIETIAQIHNISIDTLSTTLFQNSLKLFRL